MNFKENNNHMIKMSLLVVVLLVISLLSVFVVAYSTSNETQLTKTTLKTCNSGICNLIIYGGEMNRNNGTNIIPINTTIVTSSYGSYDHEMTDGLYDAYFEDNINTGEAVRFEKDGYYFIYDLSGGKMQLVEQLGNPTKTKSIGSMQSSIGSKNKNKMQYDNAFLNTNISYILENEMLKEYFILGEVPDQSLDYFYLEYTGEIKHSPELTIYSNGENKTNGDFQTNGTIEFRNQTGDTIFYLPEPVAWDSNGSESGAYYNIKVSDTKIQFGLRVNTTWLNNVTYPVYIDPTIQIDGAESGVLEDAFVYSGTIAAEEATSFIKFNISVIPLSATISDAKLYMHSSSIGDIAWTSSDVVNVSRVLDQTWTEDDAFGDLWALSTDTETQKAGAWSDGVNVNDDWDYLDVTNIVSADYGDGNSNCSFKIETESGSASPDSSSSQYFGTIYFGDSSLTNGIGLLSKEYTTVADRPYLNVTYEVISNTAPTLTANATAPATVYTNTDWLINLTATDAEESYLDSYVQFYMNDTKVGGEWTFNMTNNTNHQVATLGSGNFSKGYNLTAEVWIGDGTVNTSKANLTVVTVQNSAPVITTLQTTVNQNTSSTYTFDYNFTDADGDTMTWSDNTTLFSIGSSTGIISDTPIESEVGAFAILITATDGTDSDTDEFSYVISDTTNPVVASLTETPSDPATYSTGASYEFNATITDANLDAVLIEFDGTNYTTSNLAGDVYNFSISDLSAGTYNYIWYVNDTYGNTNYTETGSYTVNKATLSAAITNDTLLTKTYDGATTTIGISESNTGDGDVTYKLYVDGVDEGSSYTQSTAGTYSIVLNSTGGANYSSSASLDSETLTINTATPIGSVSGTSPITYLTAGDVEGTESNTGDGGCIYKLYRNGTEVSNPDTSVLGVDIYSYVYNTTGCTNYSASASLDTFSLTVTKIASEVNLTVNNTEDNITISQGSTINLNCSTITGESSGVLRLERNESEINSGTSPIGNESTFSTLGTENISCFYENTQNYTDSVKAFFVTVEDQTSPSVNLISPEQGTQDKDGIIRFIFNVTDTNEISNCSLFYQDGIYTTTTNVVNGSDNVIEIVGIEENHVLSNSNLRWGINCTDEFGNTGMSEIRDLDTKEEEIISGGTSGGTTTVIVKSPKSIILSYPTEWKQGKRINVDITVFDKNNNKYETKNIFNQHNVSGLDFVSNVFNEESSSYLMTFGVRQDAELGNGSIIIFAEDEVQVSSTINMEIVENVVQEDEKDVHIEEREPSADWVKDNAIVISIAILILLIIILIVFALA